MPASEHPRPATVRPPLHGPVPRTARRLLVVVAYVGYALLVLAWSFLPAPAKWFPIVPLGLAVVTAAGLLLAPRLLGVSDGADDELDERQLAVRNRTYLNAYRVLGLLVILAALYHMIAVSSERGALWLPRSDLAAQGLFWGAWLVAVTLPAALAAWTEPDPEEA